MSDGNTWGVDEAWADQSPFAKAAQIGVVLLLAGGFLTLLLVGLLGYEQWAWNRKQIPDRSIEVWQSLTTEERRAACLSSAEQYIFTVVAARSQPWDHQDLADHTDALEIETTDLGTAAPQVSDHLASLCTDSGYGYEPVSL